MSERTGTITNDIRALRFHHGEMTQQQLADRIGVTRQTVDVIEGNKYSPGRGVPNRQGIRRALERVFQYVAE